MTIRKKMPGLLATIGLLVLAGTTTANEIPTAKAEEVGMSTERLERIAQMNQHFADDAGVGILTAVVRDGKLVLQSAAGAKGLDDPRPLAMDDLFRIYSMTKPITAVAAMQLYEQGKFALSDPVSKFVPEFTNMTVFKDGKVVPAEHEMTMHQLLTHTAGLPLGAVINPDATVTLDSNPADIMFNKANLWQSKDLDELVEKLAKVPLRYEPGTQWLYSPAVDVTGLVIQRISGQSFDEYLTEHLFEPLDMYDTFFEVPPEKVDRLLPSHFRDWKTHETVVVPPEGTKDVPYTFAYPCAAMCNYTNVSLFLGGGGLVSTLRDFVRFAEALRAGGILDGTRILSPKTVNYMTMNHLPAVLRGGFNGEPEKFSLLHRYPGTGFGLGFAIVGDTAEYGALSSTGSYYWGGAAGTAFWIDPVEDIVVVSMMQLMNPWLNYRKDLEAATYQAIIESKE